MTLWHKKLWPPLDAREKSFYMEDEMLPSFLSNWSNDSDEWDVISKRLRGYLKNVGLPTPHFKDLLGYDKNLDDKGLRRLRIVDCEVSCLGFPHALVNVTYKLI